jgi:beta-glucosidase
MAIINENKTMTKLLNGPRVQLMLFAVFFAVAADAALAAKTLTSDERADALIAQLTLPEKIRLLHGLLAIHAPVPGLADYPLPAESIPAAGYIGGVARLGIPALFESDASLGITNPLAARPGDVATAMPSGLSLASSFNPALARRAGELLGAEAHAKGFNVLLGGGMNLTRDPRNGRNFEYLGEDPLLAGVLAGETVLGTQSQHVISTVKHFALNAHETNRENLDARIDPAALRESDLLAFELAIERGQPGSVMCSYNLINGAYACGNSWLLNQVLKHDWSFHGWVMSDWGAVRGTDYALKGLDQQSGEQLDKKIWFGEPLLSAVRAGTVPISRIDDMVHRILRSMIEVGAFDHPAVKTRIDYKAHAGLALDAARQGIVLLRNEGGLLPLSTQLRRIAVIGGNAHLGVLSGGGSSQVTPSNGAPIVVPVGGRGVMMKWRNEFFFPSSPMQAIENAAPKVEVVYDAGNFPADAAALARSADVAVVFATRHEIEGYDIPTLALPNGQDALIEAVAAANPHTVVVLETGNPVTMPWLSKVAAVLAAWYPGQEGGQAIGDLLFGVVNPSGRLPITFPVNEAQSPRPELPNLGVEPGVDVRVDYAEGADVGYRWYHRHGSKPLFAFGYGLSYSHFEYSDLHVVSTNPLKIGATIANTSQREGADVPQLYLTSIAGAPETRLLGFARVDLKPGEGRHIEFEVDRRLLAHYSESNSQWRLSGGAYTFALSRSSEDPVLQGSVKLTQMAFGP